MRKKLIVVMAVLSTAMIITVSVFRSNQRNEVFNANVEALTDDDDPGSGGGGGGGPRGHHTGTCGYTYVEWNGMLVTCTRAVIRCDYVNNNGCLSVPCPVHG